MKKNKNLTEQVYARILEMMLRYEIVPGQRLVFVDIAKKLRVSRTPVNNALSILAYEGYLDFVPNQGYSVRRILKDEAECLFDTREVFELGFIGKVVANAGEKQLAAVKKYMETYESAISSALHRDLFIFDLEFHSGIFELAENAMLATRYRNVCQKIILCLRVEEMHIVRVQQNIKEHRLLFDALVAKKEDEATELVKEHIMHSRKALAEHLRMAKYDSI